jgi:hypothetical protein
VADSRSRRRRGRSRKRRPAAASTAQDAAEQAAAAKSSAGRARTGRGSAGPAAPGERPRPPWYPLPLSELLILVGAIGTVVGLRRGVSNGGPALFAGLAAVMIGTIEVTLREHLSGYRSHALILALLPTIVFHSAVALGVSAFTRVPGWLQVALLLLDGGLFAFLFKVLRARFVDARRERKFAGRR